MKKEKRKKKEKKRKTVISEKHIDFKGPRNQGRWSMPKQKIDQYCAIVTKVKCLNFKSSWNCQQGHLSL